MGSVSCWISRVQMQGCDPTPVLQVAPLLHHYIKTILCPHVPASSLFTFKIAQLVLCCSVPHVYDTIKTPESPVQPLAELWLVRGPVSQCIPAAVLWSFFQNMACLWLLLSLVSVRASFPASHFPPRSSLSPAESFSSLMCFWSACIISSHVPPPIDVCMHVSWKRGQWNVIAKSKSSCCWQD